MNVDEHKKRERKKKAAKRRKVRKKKVKEIRREIVMTVTVYIERFEWKEDIKKTKEAKSRITAELAADDMIKMDISTCRIQQTIYPSNVY